MIVCLCTGLTDRCIAQHVESGVCDPATIMRATRAGRCSPACRAELCRLVVQFTRSKAQPHALAPANKIAQEEEPRRNAPS
ncbi:MAG: hypothetical protein KatS3mg077_0983 [Candidatus Binatia bacterium]|nr:MAG: hypothetical protein KatS3mg077_0983 [Candidatus Binatia bacterium]